MMGERDSSGRVIHVLSDLMSSRHFLFFFLFISFRTPAARHLQSARDLRLKSMTSKIPLREVSTKWSSPACVQRKPGWVWMHLLEPVLLGSFYQHPFPASPLGTLPWYLKLSTWSLHHRNWATLKPFNFSFSPLLNNYQGDFHQLHMGDFLVNSAVVAGERGV